MVDTRYKDHRVHEKIYHGRPNTFEWIGMAVLVTGVIVSFLTVAQKLESNYYFAGLILVGLGSALMFYRLLRGDDSSD
jgi:hypothetical protein